MKGVDFGTTGAGRQHEVLIKLYIHKHLFNWRRKWQPTPVFLSGEFQRQGSLVGCHLWGRTELDTTEAT